MANKAPPLEERIKSLRAEVEAFIDAKAAEVAKSSPGVPVGSIRLSITRGIGCACAAALLIAEEKGS